MVSPDRPGDTPHSLEHVNQAEQLVCGAVIIQRQLLELTLSEVNREPPPPPDSCFGGVRWLVGRGGAGRDQPVKRLLIRIYPGHLVSSDQG